MKWLQKLLTIMLLFPLPAYSYDWLSETGWFEYMERYQQIKKYENDLFRWWRWKSSGLFMQYSPQYPLWSDGAEKRRWIYIPKNAEINTKNPDDWRFPVGTRIWKEFSFRNEAAQALPIETRYLEKQANGDWLMETFVWDENRQDAKKTSEEGIKNAYYLGDGKYYDIPGFHDCQYCHTKAGIENGPQKTAVLGFSALQLSDARDLRALHNEPLSKDMVLLSNLQRIGLVSNDMDQFPEIPYSEKAPLQRIAFGYLFGNCAHCHNPAGMAEFTTTLSFFHPAKAAFIQENHTYSTALAKNITPYLNPENSPAMVIKPGLPEESALVYRFSNEVDRYQFTVPQWHHTAGFSVEVGVKMPFTGTNLVDQKALTLIKEYIKQLQTD